VKIGKNIVPHTAISTSSEQRIVVRGLDLSRDLIGKVNFGDYFFLLLTGQMPDAATSALVNATMVAIAEHGLVPSNQAARMTLAAAPDAMQGAVAAGILGAGSVVLGALETASKLFLRVEAEAAAKHGGDLKAAAKAVVTDLRANKQIVPGYGHPEHKTADPRVAALFNLSAQVGGGQKYVQLARIIESVIPEVTGKDLPMNVSAAIPAVLMGVNFPVTALKGVPMLARVASLIAHLNEEMADPIGFSLANHAVAQQQYTGTAVKD